MILCTHAIVGAALASFVPSHPAAAFAIGFISHFALDAIPHRDYPINSRSVNPRIGAPMVFDGALLRDAVTIGFDGVFGIIAALCRSLWSGDAIGTMFRRDAFGGLFGCPDRCLDRGGYRDQRATARTD
jgi:hypothetical protein